MRSAIMITEQVLVHEVLLFTYRYREYQVEKYTY